MAITQDRMLALIAAAEALQESNARVKKMVKELLTMLRAGQLKQVERLMFDLLSTTDPDLDVIDVIAREKTHFKKHFRHNQLTMNYMRRQREREKAGLPPIRESSGTKKEVLDYMSFQRKGMTERLAEELGLTEAPEVSLPVGFDATDDAGFDTDADLVGPEGLFKKEPEPQGDLYLDKEGNPILDVNGEPLRRPQSPEKDHDS